MRDMGVRRALPRSALRGTTCLVGGQVANHNLVPAMSTHAAHRQLFREFLRSGRARTRASRAPLVAHTRQLILSNSISVRGAEDMALFLKSQRTYKTLLDRYNPLRDLTAEEHIKATARRVGLDMPIEHEGSSSDSDTESQ